MPEIECCMENDRNPTFSMILPKVGKLSTICMILRLELWALALKLSLSPGLQSPGLSGELHCPALHTVATTLIAMLGKEKWHWKYFQVSQIHKLLFLNAHPSICMYDGELQWHFEYRNLRAMISSCLDGLLSAVGRNDRLSRAICRNEIDIIRSQI